MTGRTRLKDVADHLQLSRALVSGVLNGRPNVWASEETKARIFEAAKALKYQPNRAAQNLTTGRSGSVALVYRRLDEPQFRLAYSGVVDALSGALQGVGMDLVVATFSTQEGVMMHLEKLAGDRSCDAVVLWGREADTEIQGRFLEKAGLPFVVKGRHEVRHPLWNQVDYDHEGMMRKAVERLAALGHRRFAYLGFPHDEGFVRALRQGYCAAHRSLLGFDPAHGRMAECVDEVEPNEAAIGRWLEEPEPPTAFVIGSGNAAWQALEVCLAVKGSRLSLEPGGLGALGIASIGFRLLFGEAEAYQGIEVDRLARTAAMDLLRSVLTGTPSEPVQRRCPDLTAADSLDLLRRGIALEVQHP